MVESPVITDSLARGRVKPRLTELVDTFGRVHKSVRISLTDKCQLRCTYCMPAEGMPWLPSSHILTREEIVRVARILYSGGFTDFRITGGEPLIRPDAAQIIAGIQSIEGPGHPIDISLTTNALLLRKFAPKLKAAGLDRVNISLDTLRPERFVKLTLRDQFDRVMEGLQAARDADLRPIKINTLLMPGINEDEILDLVQFSVEGGYELRFIEQMPLGENKWDGSTIITQRDILDTLSTKYELSEVPGRGSAPAAKWYINGGPATVGIIASVTHPFCGDCDRLRLTADGQIRNCLFSDEETDLRLLLRSGASDEEILERLETAVKAKEPGHLIGKAGFTIPKRNMSGIGG